MSKEVILTIPDSVDLSALREMKVILHYYKDGNDLYEYSTDMFSLSEAKGDLINRDALLEAFANSEHIKETGSGLDVMEMLAIKEIIDNAPTVSDRTKEVLSLQNTIAKLVEGIAENARPQGDLISRKALKKHKFFSADNPNATRVYDETTIAYKRGWNDAIDEIIDNAPTAPQINILCENADEKAIADMKEELQKVIDDIRPQGKWIDICTLPIIRECSICGNKIGNEMGIYNNFCPNCGAKMRGDKE